MKKTISCTLILCAFALSSLFYGCEREKPGNKDGFIISTDAVEIAVGETTKVQIVGGSTYTVSCDNENIATAAIDDKTITISAKLSKGTATVKVTNKKNPKHTKDIKVKVVDVPVPEGAVIENGVLLSWDCNKIPTDGHLIIPGSVEKIGDLVFKGCDRIISVSMTNNVVSIGEEAFWGCANIEKITFSQKLTSIGKKAFWHCSNLRELHLYNEVTSIEEGAFEFCEALSNITLSNKLTNLGDRVFAASIIQKITLPGTLNKIGIGVFSNCNNLTNIEVDPSNTKFTSEDGVLLNKEKTELIQYPKGKVNNNYVIPSSVTAIRGEAFYYCSNLTSISIPDAVSRIEDKTFVGTSITEIKIPNAVTYIGEHALSQTKLISITLPANVNKLGASAFANNDNLASVTLNENIKDIPSYTFYDCMQLNSINLGTNITSIGASAFYRCASLEAIVIPNKVVSIGTMAFSDCMSMKKIHIPASVLTIDDKAFANVFDAEMVICDATKPPKLGEAVFDKIGEEERTVKLIVPVGTKTVYEKADAPVHQWKVFEIEEK
ncbi:hypothetical protein HW49_04145 [Porphyromonadaceae bacterium COT-184 OH4590]|nr:hypothetical protein HW49_04145 [Porphyromonadaceae bacterium COT-184 OH4590]